MDFVLFRDLSRLAIVPPDDLYHHIVDVELRLGLHKALHSLWKGEHFINRSLELTTRLIRARPAPHLFQGVVLGKKRRKLLLDERNERVIVDNLASRAHARLFIIGVDL